MLEEGQTCQSETEKDGEIHSGWDIIIPDSISSALNCEPYAVHVLSHLFLTIITAIPEPWYHIPGTMPRTLNELTYSWLP